MEERDNQTESLLNKFNLWRRNHISERQFILLLSLIVGVLTALVAILLKYLISLIHSFVSSGLVLSKENYSLLIYPVVGILLSGLFIRYIVRDDIGHGVTKILYALSKKNGRIKPHNMYSSVIASAITIGMGGSVGAESPIVLTGSAIGSNIGRMFKMEHRTLMLLVGCGSAGAYKLTGNSCLAGDQLGDYSFDEPLKVGDRIIFEDMIHYTMVKTTFFNGVRHPSIGKFDENGKFHLLHKFTYEQFKEKL